jgi:hypothetical protein
MVVSLTATLARIAHGVARDWGRRLPHGYARSYAIALPHAGRGDAKKSRSRGAVLRPSFVARQEARPPEKIKGRRSAERRTNWSIRLSARASPPQQLADAVHRRQVYAVRTLICFATARLPALHRGTCRCDPAQLRSRASWNRNGPDRSIPGQRAPRGPAVVPDGRVSEAARERSAKPRAGAPLSLHLQDRIRNVPFDERDGFF